MLRGVHEADDVHAQWKRVVRAVLHRFHEMYEGPQHGSLKVRQPLRNASARAFQAHYLKRDGSVETDDLPGLSPRELRMLALELRCHQSQVVFYDIRVQGRLVYVVSRHELPRDFCLTRKLWGSAFQPQVRELTVRPGLHVVETLPLFDDFTTVHGATTILGDAVNSDTTFLKKTLRRRLRGLSSSQRWESGPRADEIPRTHLNVVPAYFQ